jgi:hypothetical protein
MVDGIGTLHALGAPLLALAQDVLPNVEYLSATRATPPRRRARCT